MDKHKSCGDISFKSCTVGKKVAILLCCFGIGVGVERHQHEAVMYATWESNGLASPFCFYSLAASLVASRLLGFSSLGRGKIRKKIVCI